MCFTTRPPWAVTRSKVRLWKRFTNASSSADSMVSVIGVYPTMSTKPTAISDSRRLAVPTWAVRWRWTAARRW
jgi:hypothetical protein